MKKLPVNIIIMLLSLVLSGCISTSIGIGPVRIPVHTAEPVKKKMPPKPEAEEEEEQQEEKDPKRL